MGLLKNRAKTIWYLLAFLFMQAWPPFPVRAADLKPEDIVAKHLDSLGSSDARAAVKSRAVQGKSSMQILVGSQPATAIQGSWGLVSEQQKSKFVMRFSYPDYRGEQFVYDGNKISVAATAASHEYTRFGGFVHGQDYIIREGLLGGELSTAWAMENLEQNHPKLTYEGLKKIDGHPVHDLQYHSKHSSDMQIHLYFDPDTGRHVKTLYSMAYSPNMGRTVVDSVNQQEIRYTIEERFSDFKTADGITLPSVYSVEFTQETQNGRTNVYRWDMTVDNVSNNIGLDPKNFDTK